MTRLGIYIWVYFQAVAVLASPAKQVLNTSKLTVLDGPWDFYWNTFYTPEQVNLKPSLQLESSEPWSDLEKPYPAMGYASYVSSIELKHEETEPFIISVSRFSSAIKLLAFDENGELIAQTSNGSLAKNISIPAKGEVSLIIPRGAKQFRLVIHVANHSRGRGGLLGAPVIGTQSAISSRRTMRLALEAFTVGFILCVAFYSFFVYYRRKQLVSLLYLGLFAFGLAIRLVATSSTISNLFDSAAFVLLLRLAFFSALLVMYALVLFLSQILEIELSKTFKDLFLKINLILSSLVFVLPLHYLDDTRYGFQLYVLAVMVFSVYLVIRSIFSLKGANGLWMLLGLFGLVAGIFYDVVLVQILGEGDFQLSPVAAVGFVFIQLAITARHNADIHQKLETYSKSSKSAINFDLAFSKMFHMNLERPSTELLDIFSF